MTVQRWEQGRGPRRQAIPGEPVVEVAIDATELEPGILATIPIGQRVRLENSESADARMLVVWLAIT